MDFGFSLASWIEGRYQSVQDQLDGKTEGTVLKMRGPGGGPQGGPGGFGPGMFLGPQLLTHLDQDQNHLVNLSEIKASWNRWETTWDSDKDNFLTEKELNQGLAQLFPMPDLGPMGPPAGFHPGMMLIQPLMKKADGQGKLHPAAAAQLWEEWFTTWDSDQSDTWTEQEIITGLNQVVGTPPGFGPPPGF
ncbi:MAG: hypothetical protein RBU29_14580 [bacterium]|jgi:hypothetical protein|nr:hypothetical protein [bacterium]